MFVCDILGKFKCWLSSWVKNTNGGRYVISTQDVDLIFIKLFIIFILMMSLTSDLLRQKLETSATQWIGSLLLNPLPLWSSNPTSDCRDSFGLLTKRPWFYSVPARAWSIARRGTLGLLAQAKAFIFAIWPLECRCDLKPNKLGHQFKVKTVLQSSGHSFISSSLNFVCNFVWITLFWALRIMDHLS